MNGSITFRKQSRSHRDAAIEYYNKREYDKAFEEFDAALEKLSEERYFFNQNVMLERLRINRDKVYCYLFLGDLSNAMKTLQGVIQERKVRAALWDLLKILLIAYVVLFIVISLLLKIPTTMRLPDILTGIMWSFIGVIIIAPGATFRIYRTYKETKRLDSEIKLLNAFVLYSQGNYRKALEQIEETTKIKTAMSTYLKEKALEKLGSVGGMGVARNTSKDAAAWVNLGTLFFMAKKPEEANECYTKALEIEPDNAYALTGKGRVHMEKKEYEKAIEQYEKALKLDPKIVNAWVDEGTAYFHLGDLDKSIECYTKALEIEPDNNTAKLLRDKAIKALNE